MNMVTQTQACTVMRIWTHTHTSAFHNYTQFIKPELLLSIQSLMPPPHHSLVVDKVSDPVMAVQISWMMEVPQLYRQCYDKPFHLDSSAQNIQG